MGHAASGVVRCRFYDFRSKPPASASRSKKPSARLKPIFFAHRCACQRACTANVCSTDYMSLYIYICMYTCYSTHVLCKNRAHKSKLENHPKQTCTQQPGSSELAAGPAELALRSRSAWRSSRSSRRTSWALRSLRTCPSSCRPNCTTKRGL